MRFFADQGLLGDITDVWTFETQGRDAGLNDSLGEGFKVASTGYDGKQYFVPWGYYIWGVYYRPSLFEEKQLDAADEPRRATKPLRRHGGRPDGSGWAPRFSLDAVDETGDDRITYRLVDDVARLAIRLDLDFGDVFTIRAVLENRGDSAYVVERHAPSIPLPAHATDLLTFAGRWCREFQPRRSDFEGTTLVENRTGRTSHSKLPAMFAGSTGFGEQHGEVWGVQLAWSGTYAARYPTSRNATRRGSIAGRSRSEPTGSSAAPSSTSAGRRACTPCT